MEQKRSTALWLRVALGFVVAGGLAAAPSAVRAQDFRLEAASTETLRSLSKPLRDSLDPQGMRLVASVNEVKTTICELWWKKEIEAPGAGHKLADVLYGGLRPGSVIGVLYYPNEAQAELFRRDFRNQVMEPGFYTMRYAQIKQDKDLVEIRGKDKGEQDDDMRVSPYRDFVVLTSVRNDAHVDRALSFDEMFRQGRLTTKSKNPAILSLVRINPAYKNFPTLVPEDSGDCSLQFKVRQKGAKGAKETEVPVAVLLITPHISLGES
jgi:hypothetical protein